MKHTRQIKRKSVVKAQRDLDLTLAARRVRNRYRGMWLAFGRLVDLTLESPAPGYYVDPDYAMRMLTPLRRGEPARGSALKRQMWEELHRRTLEAVERYRLTRYSEGLYRVLGSGYASRFFVSRSTAAQVIGGR